MKYFSLEELVASEAARRYGIDNEPSEKISEALTELVDNVLDPLREVWGKPIIVNSGYRSPALNRAVGGAAHSQHLLGEAADITAGSVAGNRRLYDLLQRLQLPVDQAINEHGYSWIHVSHTRRRNNRRQFFSQ